MPRLVKGVERWERHGGDVAHSCKLFRRGLCRDGATCRFRHDGFDAPPIREAAQDDAPVAVPKRAAPLPKKVVVEETPEVRAARQARAIFEVEREKARIAKAIKEGRQGGAKVQQFHPPVSSILKSAPAAPIGSEAWALSRLALEPEEEDGDPVRGALEEEKPEPLSVFESFTTANTSSSSSSTSSSSEVGYRRFPSATVGRVVELLKSVWPEGVSLTDLPDAFYALHGECLAEAEGAPKHFSLLDLVDGHPKVLVYVEEEEEEEEERGQGWQGWQGGVGGGRFSANPRLYYEYEGEEFPQQQPLYGDDEEEDEDEDEEEEDEEEEEEEDEEEEEENPPATHPTPPLSPESEGVYDLSADVVGEDEVVCFFHPLVWLITNDAFQSKVYRWAGNETEWVEFALSLRQDVVAIVEAALGFLRSESGCEMTIETERIHGQQRTLLRFVRGPSGDATNDCMEAAVAVTSRVLASYLGHDAGLEMKRPTRPRGPG